MTNNEAKNIIINNQMTYNDFANYFNISVNNTIRIFQYLDLKKCSKGKNCVNVNGPFQSRKNFYSDKTRQDGLNTQCNYCLSQRHQNNREHYNQLSLQHYQNNREYYNQLSRRYHQNNKKHCNQRNQQYYQNNREYYKQKHRQYQQNNRNYYREKIYEHYQANKEHYKQKNKEYKFKYSKFDIFNGQIEYAEKTRRDSNNLELLQVKCTYCNSWFNPTNQQIQARIDALEGRRSLGTENRFYCSDECKESCPIYKQIQYSKDGSRYINNLGTSREVQSELRQLVFERDNWTCQRCNTYKDNLADGISLHCHHKEGVRYEPIESADIDMCITVCSECHKEIHKIPGCTRQDMQCKEIH